MKTKILIYGATGYTARLFIELAGKHQLPIVLGARSEIVSGYETRCFSLDNYDVISEHLNDIKLLINLAGPFARTNLPLVEACIGTNTHYLDISGEYADVETVYRYHAQAVKAGIMLMPASGFGVVPTDIAASMAKELMPDANALIISYITEGAASRGTLNTILKGIAKPGIKLVNGKQEPALPAHTTLGFRFKEKFYSTVYNPWRADLFSAMISTGIPNIQTFSNFPGFVVKMMHGKLVWLRNFILNTAIRWLPEGPNKKQLLTGKTIVLARTINEKGTIKEIVIEGPEAYIFTIQSLLAISTKILADNYIPGFQTPSIYGKELISGISGVIITNH